jgi:hypothetical protein
MMNRIKSKESKSLVWTLDKKIINILDVKYLYGNL